MENNENDCFSNLLNKIMKISQFNKKIKLVDDPLYYSIQSKEYSGLLNESTQRIENLIKDVMKYTNYEQSSKEEIDLSKNFHEVTDFIDDIVERINDNLDIYKGIKKEKKEEEIEEELKLIKLKKMKNQTNLIKNATKIILNSPDDEFDIDNSYYPFIPKIKEKYFSNYPISKDILEAREYRIQNKEKFKKINFEDRVIAYDGTVFENPYKHEIETFINNNLEKFDEINNFICKFVKNEGFYDDFNKFIKDISIESFDSFNFFENNLFIRFFKNSLSKSESEVKNILSVNQFKYKELSETPFLYVDSLELLELTIKEIIESNSEVAVDLEHHSQESYLGITCLMQISTRFKDYIVDCIKLRPYMHLMNKVFCNPEIIKVLHGADFDVVWLQKDFGIYVVNMFDTGQAARILGLSGFSLSYLLLDNCGIMLDKQYQVSDWRLRPLPADMLKYAQEDTHYLLYLYDILKKKLIQKAVIKHQPVFSEVMIWLKKSNELCLKNFIKPVIKSLDYYQIIAKNAGILNKRQLSFLKLLYKFRDYVGRCLDYSASYVLNNRSMFILCKLREITYDNILEHLGNNTLMYKFLDELIALVNKKIEKIEAKIDKNSVSVLENTYLQNMEKRMNKPKNDFVQKPKKIENNSKKEDFFRKAEQIELNQIKTKQSTSLFSANNNSKKENLNKQVNDLVIDFSNFSLITYLKDKYKIQNVEIKVSQQNKPKAPIVNKQLPKEEIKTSSQTDFLNKKRNPDFIDLTDSTKLINAHNNNINDDDIDEEEEEDLKQFSKNRKGKVSDTIKNMQASSNFLKKLINK